MSKRMGMKIFSATKHAERNNLGEVVTHWLNSEPAKLVKDIRTIQSSDSEFHCLSIVVIYEVPDEI